MFFIESEPLPGVFIIKYKSLNDNRGQFNKIFESKFFDDLGLNFQPEEYFFSTSKKNVLRGMHFQIEEAAHDKLVFCTYGSPRLAITTFFLNLPIRRLKRGVFHMCGIYNINYRRYFAVPFVSEEKRKKFLEDVKKTALNI